jgi:hypothetical protein
MLQLRSTKTLLFRAITLALAGEARAVNLIGEWVNRYGLKRVPLLRQLLRITGLARRAVRWLLLRIPGLAYHKMATDLDVVCDVYSILDEMGVDYFLVGGVACEAKVFGGCGRWYHKDIDIAVLDPDVAILCNRLSENGCLSRPYSSTLRVRRAGTEIDIFIWEEKAGFVRTQFGEGVLRMPRSSFRHDIVDLCGAPHKVACDDYIARIAPVVVRPESKKCVEAIAARVGFAGR